MGHIRELMAGTWLVLMTVAALKVHRNRRMVALILASAGVFAWGWTSGTNLAWGCLMAWMFLFWRKPGTKKFEVPLLALGIFVGVAAYWRGPDVALGALVGFAVGFMVLYRAPRVLPSRGRVMPHRAHVLVCNGSTCRQRGAEWIRRGLADRNHGPDTMRVTPVHCLGACQDAPVLLVEPWGRLMRRVRIKDLAVLRGRGGSHEN